MDVKHPMLDKTNYEISDLVTIFNMRGIDDINSARDYGTGKSYTMLEAHTVTLIERHPGITVTGISAFYGRSKSAISQLISRLEKKGLVRRARVEGESLRTKSLWVTAEGRKLSHSHITYDEEHVARHINDLIGENGEFTAEELNTAYRYMESMIKRRLSNTLKNGEDN